MTSPFWSPPTPKTLLTVTRRGRGEDSGNSAYCAKIRGFSHPKVKVRSTGNENLGHTVWVAGNQPSAPLWHYLQLVLLRSEGWSLPVHPAISCPLQPWANPLPPTLRPNLITSEGFHTCILDNSIECSIPSNVPVQMDIALLCVTVTLFGVPFIRCTDFSHPVFFYKLEPKPPLKIWLRYLWPSPSLIISYITKQALNYDHKLSSFPPFYWHAFDLQGPLAEPLQQSCFTFWTCITPVYLLPMILNSHSPLLWQTPSRVPLQVILSHIAFFLSSPPQTISPNFIFLQLEVGLLISFISSTIQTPHLKIALPFSCLSLSFYYILHRMWDHTMFVFLCLTYFT